MLISIFNARCILILKHSYSLCLYLAATSIFYEYFVCPFCFYYICVTQLSNKHKCIYISKHSYFITKNLICHISMNASQCNACKCRKVHAYNEKLKNNIERKRMKSKILPWGLGIQWKKVIMIIYHKSCILENSGGGFFFLTYRPFTNKKIKLLIVTKDINGNNKRVDIWQHQGDKSHTKIIKRNREK